MTNELLELYTRVSRISVVGSNTMIRRRNQIRPKRPVNKKRPRITESVGCEPGTTMQVLARDELREIIRRLALGDRPGIALDPIPVRR